MMMKILPATFAAAVMAMLVLMTIWFTVIVRQNADIIRRNAAAGRGRHAETMRAIEQLRREGVDRTKLRFTSEDARRELQVRDRAIAELKRIITPATRPAMGVSN
jgi:hypothetical protein